MRQMDLLDPDRLPPVCIVGWGGIGSAVGLFLAKMGVKHWTIYEFDEVEHHNLSNQLFPNDSIHKRKIDVAVEEIRRYSPSPSEVEIDARGVKFERGSDFNGSDAVISCLDNMEARRVVWDAVKAEFPSLYIDTRMGGEVAKVYALNPLDGAAVRYYETQLTQGDHEVKCTAQAIAYNVGLISAIVGSIIRRFATEIQYPRLVIADALNLEFIKL